MSWADIIYSKNKASKTKLIQNFQKLEDEMKNSFRASNKLARYLSQNFEEVNIQELKYENSKSVKENAEAFVTHINIINAHLDRIAKELKEKLSPDLYTKLTNLDTTFQERIEISQKAGKVFANVTGISVAVVVGTIVSTKLTTMIASTVGRIALSSVAATIAGGLAGLTVDVIIGAITGALEKRELKRALQELEPMVNEFMEESQEYTATIDQVLAEVKVWEKYHPNT